MTASWSACAEPRHANRRADGALLGREAPERRATCAALGLFWAVELVRDTQTREPLVPFNASGGRRRPDGSHSPRAAKKGGVCAVHALQPHARGAAAGDQRGRPGARTRRARRRALRGRRGSRRLTRAHSQTKPRRRDGRRGFVLCAGSSRGVEHPLPPRPRCRAPRSDRSPPPDARTDPGSSRARSARMPTAIVPVSSRWFNACGACGVRDERGGEVDRLLGRNAS